VATTGEGQNNAEGSESNDSSGGILTTRFQSSFEIDLGTSRVYRRTQLYQSDMSFTSSAVRTHVWSIFSGLSLADVSKISAIALPVYSDDISNNEWSKFVFSDTACPSNTDTLTSSSVPVRPPSNCPKLGSLKAHTFNWSVITLPDYKRAIPSDIGQDLNTTMVYKLVETSVLIKKAGYSPLRFS
jgi:hypothetical protein